MKHLEELVSKLSMFLHPHHYHLYSVKHSLVQLYGHQHGYQINQLSDQQLQRKAGMYESYLTLVRKLCLDFISEIDP